jgi:hypothetical protein
MTFREAGLQISEFEWDEGNVLHFELGHGIEPEEAEEVIRCQVLNRDLTKNIGRGVRRQHSAS